ncbi:General transcriptional corepressor ssn6 [Smittium mucronatum]|uniref:General transcriptional corepressor ssn6 n=1 Tax=Smittium mucronatum TaxID=133383 RepID=A0A1R0H8L2_9FUNG|nr:General transcriptional corepressor ssn6 [Smittium mucronatum]
MSNYHDNPNLSIPPSQDPGVAPIVKASNIQRGGPLPVDANNISQTNPSNYGNRTNPPGYSPQLTPMQRLSILDEQTWYQIGSMAESMGDYKQALKAYENGPRHNPYSLRTLQRMALLYRQQEDIGKAIEMYQRIISIDGSNGETWGALGHCYLMIGDLAKTYHAYQQALNHISDTKDPKLWYGIGILYECYNAYDSAEEAFIAVMQMDPKFEKSSEVYFRLGIIHKCQRRYKDSLNCFKYILNSPPKPLSENDVWFQIGNVHELQNENDLALNAYKRVLTDDPNHPKALLHLGMLLMKPEFDLYNPDNAFRYLSRAVKADKDDSQAWYILGRCEMLLKHYNNAYEAYQKAVYCEPTNPIYWCSIGVLYFQINQFRDSLDAYSRSIKLDPVNREVWFNLGTLYEACNSQTADAIDAYYHASQLDPKNTFIQDRLNFLKSGKSDRQSGTPLSTPQPIETSISDLQAISIIPQTDVDNQVNIPGNLGRPPVPVVYHSLFPPRNDLQRSRIDDAPDHYSHPAKDFGRGNNRMAIENEYPIYSEANNINDQDKMGPSQNVMSRDSPSFMRNSDLNNDSENSRSRIANSRAPPPNNNRGYNYPSAPHNPSVPSNLINSSSVQHRPSDAIPGPPSSVPRNMNRQNQPVNRQIHKQEQIYSPGNNYHNNRRSSVVIRGSPMNYNAENGPNNSEMEGQVSYGNSYKDQSYGLYNNGHGQEQYGNHDNYHSVPPETRHPNPERYPSSVNQPTEKISNPPRGYPNQNGPGNYENSKNYNHDIKSMQSNYPERESNTPVNNNPNPNSRISRLSLSNNPSSDGRSQFQPNSSAPKTDSKPTYGRAMSPDSLSINKPLSSQPYDRFRSNNSVQPQDNQRSSYYPKNEPTKYDKSRSPAPNPVHEAESRSPLPKSIPSYNPERQTSSVDNFHSYSSHKDKFRLGSRQWDSTYTTKETGPSSNSHNIYNDRAPRNDKNSSFSARDPYFYEENTDKSHATQTRPNDVTQSFPNTPIVNDESANQSKAPIKSAGFNRDRKYSPEIKEPIPESQPTASSFNRDRESPKSIENSENTKNKSPSYRTPDVNEIRGQSWWADKDTSPNSERPFSDNKKFPSSNNINNSRQTGPQNSRKSKNPSISNLSRELNDEEPDGRLSRHSSLAITPNNTSTNQTNSFKSPAPSMNYGQGMPDYNPPHPPAKSENPYDDSENNDRKLPRLNKEKDQNLENNRISYLIKNENNYDSEPQQLVPSKRDNPSGGSNRDNFSNDNGRDKLADDNHSPDPATNSASDSTSIKSDSSRPLYKRVRNSDYTENSPPNTLNHSIKSPPPASDSFKRQTQDKNDISLPRMSVHESQSAEGRDSVDKRPDDNPRLTSNIEEPEDGEVFEDDELIPGPGKDFTHNIKYGENLDNFRALKTVNSSPEKPEARNEESKDSQTANPGSAKNSPRKGEAVSDNNSASFHS